MSALCLGCERPIAAVSGVRLDVTATVGSARTVARVPLCGHCGAEALEVIGRYVGLTPGELARLARAEMIGGQVVAAAAE